MVFYLGPARRWLAEDCRYRTGVLGRYLPTGGVDFVGRADDPFQIRGFRIEHGESERLMDSHPLVRKSVVVARSLAGGEEGLVGSLVVRPVGEGSV